MKVLVTGSRAYEDRGHVALVLGVLHKLGFDEVIEGGQGSYLGQRTLGADRLSREEALKLGMEVTTIQAQWAFYGKGAGPKRNTAMLTMEPDLVVYFHSDLAKSRGTKDMVQKAQRERVPVVDSQQIATQKEGFQWQRQ